MKKITLGIAALFAAFTMNAQSDCSNAQAITVGDDATTTVNATGISGTAPTSTCNTYGTTVDGQPSITTADWYSFTAGSNDLMVTVVASNPETFNPEAETAEGVTPDYLPTFNVYQGTCGDLSCANSIGDARFFTSQDNDGNLIFLNAESNFLAEAGETYYIVFDDFYNNSAGLGSLDAFTFDVTTDSDVPEVPGAVTNPTPADGATNVDIFDTTDNQGNPRDGVSFSWNAPTTGGAVDAYDIYFSEDPDNLERLGAIQGEGATIFMTLPDDYNTTFYWKVVPTNIAGGDVANAPTWSFTTEGEMSVDAFKNESLTHYVSNGLLNINAEQQLNKVTLYSILGSQVASQEVNNTNATIEISNLQAGVYLAQVQVEGKTKTFKFVKK